MLRVEEGRPKGTKTGQMGSRNRARALGPMFAPLYFPPFLMCVCVCVMVFFFFFSLLLALAVHGVGAS